MSEMEFAANSEDSYAALFGEVMVALHNVAARQLHEKAEACRIDPEAFYEQILLRFYDHEQFRSLSNRLVDSGKHKNMYAPAETNSTIVIFATQFFEEELLCQQLLTSYAIGLMNRGELLKLELPDELKLAALI